MRDPLATFVRMSATSKLALVVGSLGYAVTFFGAVQLGIRDLQAPITPVDVARMVINTPWLLLAFAVGCAGTAIYLIRVLSGEEPNR